MSIQAKRIFKKLISWSGLLFFLLAAGMLYWQLSKYSLIDIWNALTDIPAENLVIACLACLGGYVALSFYDYLALRYVGKMVSWWKWMLAGMLGFAISNNAGHAVISGGSIRYRLYTRWRIRAGEIIKMVVFSGFTYFLGCAGIVALGWAFAPKDLFGKSVFAGLGIDALLLFCLLSLAVYYGMAIFYRKSVRIADIKFRAPSIGTALRQTGLGMLDSVLAGLVLYAILAPTINMPFITFLSIFVIAQVVGVFSQVPGGIGVFESVFMLAMPELGDGATLFAGLIAYRIIYYLLPLVGIGSMFFIYERILRERMKRWLREAEEKAAAVKEKLGHIHIPHPHLHSVKKSETKCPKA